MESNQLQIVAPNGEFKVQEGSWDEFMNVYITTHIHKTYGRIQTEKK